MIRRRNAAASLAMIAGATALLTACAPPADRAGPVDIGDGRELYLECHGTGSPTVILVSGLGDNADIWGTPADAAASPDGSASAEATESSDGSGAAGASGSRADRERGTVYGDVAEFTRACAYDRPGTTESRSTEVAQPTSAQTSADDLEKLLAASGEAAPFVLVGHSYGGPIIRLFATDHPDGVAGLVLVDGLSEDLAAGLTPQQQAVFEALNAPPARANAETFDTATVFAELRESSPVPDVPVTVLTADTPQLTAELLASGLLPPGVDQVFADALWAAQMAAQAMLPLKFADATHITDTSSDHYIQLENPQLVVSSIRSVVDEAR